LVDVNSFQNSKTALIFWRILLLTNFWLNLFQNIRFELKEINIYNLRSYCLLRRLRALWNRFLCNLIIELGRKGLSCQVLYNLRFTDFLNPLFGNKNRSLGLKLLLLGYSRFSKHCLFNLSFFNLL
jgi:hypothetical protein